MGRGGCGCWEHVCASIVYRCSHMCIVCFVCVVCVLCVVCFVYLCVCVCARVCVCVCVVWGECVW